MLINGTYTVKHYQRVFTDQFNASFTEKRKIIFTTIVQLEEPAFTSITFWITDVCILPREGIKAVSFAGVREGHTQAGHEGRVKDHCRALVPGCQVYRWHRPYTLTVQYDVFWGHSIPSEGKRKKQQL